ncbi:hypothetical protein CA51_09650 [Rosistilla oblonga]|uniref:DUF58 domain-containing protein n=1 Tax=Rosistilla oblonga TaxID=2527990 RepID=UPI00118C84F4|nr:DUF58 domain-containing protein [Rosistilla oblonga]QDV11105.1 hypothetical protein CA51_09650 [Rosistilla oblonga]
MYQTFAKYLDHDAYTALNALRLKSRHRFAGSAAGEHRSFRMGQAIEFAQHRQYAPGDDLRYLDWKIYGRTDKYYLKQSEDETDLCCYVLLDNSESMSFAGTDSEISKLQYARKLAVALAFVTLAGQDRIGLGMLSDRLFDYLPPSSAISQLSRWDEVFEKTPAAGGTDLPSGVAQFVDQARQPGLVVLISDLLGPEQGLQGALTLLRGAGHDAIVLHVMDRQEREFRFDGELHFEGLESAGEVDVNGAQIRNAYLEELDNFIEKQRQNCWGLGFEFSTVLTDFPLAAALSSHFRH